MSWLEKILRAAGVGIQLEFMQRLLISWFLLHSMLMTSLLQGQVAENQLSPEEKKSGWYLLFDGISTEGWRAIQKNSFPSAQWEVQEGWLHCLGKGGGDIITERQFEQFELSFEWKLESGGNSGVKYFIQEQRGAIGHEYQIIDDVRHPDGGKAEGKRITAAFYDVLAPQTKTPTKNPLEVNFSRIIVKGDRVEHWLNGTRVLEYELGSEAVKAAVGQSKFKDTHPFGVRVKGHILLQDHNDEVWYRNIKIKELGK